MVRILLLADEALGWQDLARQLRTCPGVTAVQLTHDRATALALLAHFQPDLLVLGSDHLAEPPDPALLALLAQQPSLLLARTLQAHLLDRLLSAGLPLRGLLTWADLDRAAVPALLALLSHSPLLVTGPAAAAELASGGSAAAWQSALFAALLGFLAGALVMLATTRWQRGASR